MGNSTAAVIYFSLDGNTRYLAQTIADAVPDTGTPLLTRVMHNGTRTDTVPSLDALRQHTEEALTTLPPRLHALEDVQAYPVAVSDALQARTEATAERLRTERTP